MKKVCPQCGAEIKENAKFCGKCGTRYEESKNGNTSTRQEVQQKQIIVPRKRKLKVLAIVLVIAIAILLIFVPGSGKNWEDVVKEYFSVSQNKFSQQKCSSQSPHNWCRISLVYNLSTSSLGKPYQKVYLTVKKHYILNFCLLIAQNNFYKFRCVPKQKIKK